MKEERETMETLSLGKLTLEEEEEDKAAQAQEKKGKQRKQHRDRRKAERRSPETPSAKKLKIPKGLDKNIGYRIRDLCSCSLDQVIEKVGTAEVGSFVTVCSGVEWVDTPEALQGLKSLLEVEREFTLDCEHHCYYSFRGMICLLQIGIPRKGTCYLVDAIKLKECVRLLQEILENENILKIMHGASNDVLWLQRDFSIW